MSTISFGTLPKTSDMMSLQMIAIGARIQVDINGDGEPRCTATLGRFSCTKETGRSAPPELVETMALQGLLFAIIKDVAMAGTPAREVVGEGSATSASRSRIPTDGPASGTPNPLLR